MGGVERWKAEKLRFDRFFLVLRDGMSMSYT